MMKLFPSRFLVCIALFPYCTLIPGCSDDDDTITPVVPARVDGIWQGEYISGVNGDSGVCIMELQQTGSDLSGQFVFRSAGSQQRLEDARVLGSVSGDRFTLQPDMNLTPYYRTLSISLNLLDSISASGEFSFMNDSLMAVPLQISRLRKGTTVLLDSMIVNDYVRSIAFSNDRLWLSTSEYFLVLPGMHSPAETTIITYSIGVVSGRWTSSTLAARGALLWGDLPGSRSQGPNYSHILTFDTSGIVTGSFDIPHRTSGLAHDGSALWTSCSGPNRFYRLTPSGAFDDSIDVGIPDATHLEYGNGSFWSVGWHTKKLYKFDPDGNVGLVYDLPREALNLSPLGLAFDGRDFWFAREIPASMGRGSILYTMRLQ